MAGAHRQGSGLLPARLSLSALLAVLAALSACSSNDAVPDYSSPGSSGSSGTSGVVNPPRSSRGNPPFYEVFGKRYYVMQSSNGYRERGVASWYGQDFHGKPTSSGEIYNMHGMTAAHKTLPLPTWVEVTNQVNGKSVILKVNDRGPFVGDRIIDLSYKAALELDMIRSGTARVSVRALGAPAAVPASPAPVVAGVTEQVSRPGFAIISEAQAGTLQPGDLPGEGLFAQVGAFGDRNNALRFVAELKGAGFTNTFITAAEAGGTLLYRVRIGPLSDADQFDRVRSGLRSMGVAEARLVVDNN
jgi:rare lipoprotein A